MPNYLILITDIEGRVSKRQAVHCDGDAAAHDAALNLLDGQAQAEVWNGGMRICTVTKPAVARNGAVFSLAIPRFHRRL